MGTKRKLSASGTKNKKRSTKPQRDGFNVRDYPSMMSLYEKESLAAEAQLKAEREEKRSRKPRRS
jgi:hypothetical protein